MGASEPMTVLSLCLFYYGLFVVSSVVPWVNAEVILLSLVPLARSQADLVILAVLATVGQMTGKGVLYWTAWRTVRRGTSHAHEKLARWQAWIDGRYSRRAPLVFLSAAVGVPPFYIVTLAAGALRIRFVEFLAVGCSGRLVRFGCIALFPRLVFGPAI